MNFCNPNWLDLRALSQILAGVIRLEHSEFAGVYQMLRHSFTHRSRSPFLDDFVRKPLSLINPDLLRSPTPAYPGIDLPCWIETSTSTPTIVLLGQDPLRDETYFTAPANDQPYVVIGTPYSIHSQALRTWRNNPRYWTLIVRLLDAGYSLYLTDIVKFWVKDQRAPQPTAAGAYKTILLAELNLVSRPAGPAFVVAFGTNAATALLGPAFAAGRRIRDSKAEVFSKDSIRVIPVLHPSPQNTPILPGYLRANDVDPATGVAGIAEVITRAIARFKAN